MAKSRKGSPPVEGSKGATGVPPLSPPGNMVTSPGTHPTGTGYGSVVGMFPPPPPGAPSGNPYPGLGGSPNPNDPAFQPPAMDASLKDRYALMARAAIVTREVPNVVIQTGWNVSQVRAALQDLVVGLFDRPAQLLDVMAGDSRVRSAMKSRSGGLFSSPIRFKPARHRDKELAKKACRRWERHWPHMSPEPAMFDLQETSALLGFAYSQILWDTTSSKKEWRPYLQAFNPRYSWFHWIWRVHVAVTRDGQFPITGGDGHWLLHTPNGSYRGWLRGALWSVAQWFLARQYALRDWARYCERHGFPILLADVPFGADPTSIATYQSQLTTLGQENVLQLPNSFDLEKFGKYDLRYLEPKDQNWQAFQQIIGQCNEEITLAILGQNLTTQVKEGSLAAARVHADVRQAILEADARQLANTLHVQLLRPWAAINFDDPNLAPQVVWDVRPQEDLEQKARTFQAFAGAINQLRQAGLAPTDARAFAKRFGLVGMNLIDVPPVAIEAQLARATGEVSDASSGGLTKVAPTADEMKQQKADEKAKADEAKKAEPAAKPKPKKDGPDQAHDLAKAVQKSMKKPGKAPKTPNEEKEDSP